MKTLGKSLKVALPLAAAAAVCTVAVVGAMSSDNGSSHPHERAAESKVAAPPPARAAVGDPSNPATWRLPVEAYMPAPSARLTITNVRDDLMDACMSKAGFDNWTPAPDLPNIDGASFTDGRYGISDAEQVTQWGYHRDPALMRSYNDAMLDGAVDESGADDAQVRQCVQEADGSVTAVQTAPLVEQIDIEGYKTSLTDPAVKGVFAKWSACMKGKGYSYATPPDAQEDPKFTDPEKITPAEIATAKADLSCRNQYPVVKTWFDTEVKLQQAAIAKNQGALDDIQATNQAQAAKANSLAQAQ
ncbi:hypothetical protein QA802_31660 [Streptomyces sp. B21-105]|uniref:hypothetical protein n=1 Tax=Streptomyces sp. B21-105 TaxID=3039417 RepID=UPI002FF2CF5B